jgi:hypothetical protein
MSRHHDPTDTLDAAAVAELAALDATLADDTADPEWAALVAAVRDEAPTPRPRFQAELDDRVAAGFPRARPAWLRVPARRMLPALAVASTLLIGGVVVGTGTLDGNGPGPVFEAAKPDSETTGDGSGADSASEVAPAPAGRNDAPPVTRSSGSSAATESASPPPSAASPAPLPSAVPGSPSPAPPASVPGGPRKVERTTSLGLTTDAKGLQDAADGIVRATQDLDGIVESSQVDSSPSGGEATFVLRIPSARLDDALKRFGELADVARLSQGSEDITSSFVSAQDRLSDARAERKALLAALGKATTPRSIASLRTRIRGNRAEIARLEGDLRGLRRRADLARVDVTLSARGRATDPDAGSGWGPGDAARDALRVFEVVAGVALVAGAVLLPLALLAGGAALAGSGLRRRRREAALGAG